MDQWGGRHTQRPDEASRGAARSQITTETIASGIAITTKTRNARLIPVYHRALSPRQPNNSASAADRIAFLTSARSGWRSTCPIGSEQEVSQSNRVVSLLSSEHRVQPYLGHPRTNAAKIEPVRSITMARQNEPGNPGEKQQCARVARLYLC